MIILISYSAQSAQFHGGTGRCIFRTDFITTTGGGWLTSNTAQGHVLWLIALIGALSHTGGISELVSVVNFIPQGAEKLH